MNALLAAARRVWLDLRHLRIHSYRVARIAGRPGGYTTNPCNRCYWERHV